MPPTFAQLGVPNPLCRALSRRGIDRPFDIQAAVIPDALAGRDICGRAPTGSGKTLAFGVPLVATVARGGPKRPRGLVLAPTRELADQIATELRSFAGDLRVCTVYGGVGYGKQEHQLRRGADIVVACPGRLEDLVGRGSLELTDVDRVVIDEADRLADMGFLPAVRRILDLTARERQTVLYSATLEGDVAELTRDHQHDPVRHEVGDATPDITAADHVFWQLEHSDRIDAAARAIADHGQAIVFCRTRHGSDRLARQLGQRGVAAAAIHGGHAQNRRTRTLDGFTAGAVQALVATDVAARGIHVDDVALVLHYDPPADHTTYIHRSGRTARAGRGGVVVSLLLPDQVTAAKRMASKLGLQTAITRPDASAPTGADAGTANVRARDERRTAEHRPQRHGTTGNRTDRQQRSRRRNRRPHSATGR